MLTVSFRLEGGRTASMLELALFPGTRMERMARDGNQGNCPRGHIAICYVSVKCKSDSMQLPVPRDRRKTICDLNEWMHSIADSGQPLLVKAALRCQFFAVESSGCLSSALCLVQSLIENESTDTTIVRDASAGIRRFGAALQWNGSFYQSKTENHSESSLLSR